METERCGDYRISFRAENPHIYEVVLTVDMFNKLTSIYDESIYGIPVDFSNHPFFPMCPYWYATLGRSCRKVKSADGAADGADGAECYVYVPIPLAVKSGSVIELEFSVPVSTPAGKCRVIDTHEPCPSSTFFGYDMVEIIHGTNYGEHTFGIERTTDMFILFGNNLTRDLVLDIPDIDSVEYCDGYHVYHFSLRTLTSIGLYRRGIEGVQRIFLMGRRMI